MNLYCPGQKALTKQGQDNYDKIFQKDGYKRFREYLNKESESKSLRMNEKDLNGLVKAIKDGLK